MLLDLMHRIIYRNENEMGSNKQKIYRSENTDFRHYVIWFGRYKDLKMQWINGFDLYHDNAPCALCLPHIICYLTDFLGLKD